MAKREYSLNTRRPTIAVSQGVVRGIEEKLPNGGSFYSFKGIPYAEPPIGELRFEVSMFRSICICSLFQYLVLIYRSHLDP